jgi:hypothetical protein
MPKRKQTLSPEATRRTNAPKSKAQKRLHGKIKASAKKPAASKKKAPNKPLAKFNPRLRSAAEVKVAMSRQKAAGSSTPAATLDSVTFSAGWDINQDDGSGNYQAPQWQNTPARSYPYLYSDVSGTNILTVSAVWTLASSVSSAPYVQGTGPGGINIPSTQATIDSSGTTVTLPATAASTAFPNQTNYYNPFTIQWQISFDGGSTWEDAGTSQNPIYVCLQGPVSGVPSPFRTVVHLACSKTGATNADQAVAKTWALFSGPANVCRWDGSPLYYYKPGTTFDISQNPVTTAGLLKVGSAECFGWAHLLQDAWTLNGVTSQWNEADPIGYQAFWVKTWTALPTSGDFYFQSTSFDMNPYPRSGSPPRPDPYGYYDKPGGTNFKNERTLYGQNSAPGAPAEKVFGNHQFLKYNGTYYDPSYGVTYTGPADFQSKAVAGFGNQIVPSPSPTNLVMSFDIVTATTSISFSV